MEKFIKLSVVDPFSSVTEIFVLPQGMSEPFSTTVRGHV